jgi:hypothetical protein
MVIGERTLRKRTLIPVAILLSVIFNIGFVLVNQGNEILHWPFFELGPAVLQDSFFSRAPGLESVFGLIGDIPGGYSLYSGNPLQTGDWGDLTGSTLNPQILIMGILFALIPILIVIILGRRSYGSTKTQ